MITLQIDGQSFPIPDEIAAKDELLKAALAPFVPWIANAQIDRKEQEGKLLVNIIKRADWKGNAVVDALISSPEEMNPAVALWMQIQGQLDMSAPETILALEPSIATALHVGDQEISAVRDALTRLVACSSTSAHRIPLGF